MQTGPQRRALNTATSCAYSQTGSWRSAAGLACRQAPAHTARYRSYDPWGGGYPLHHRPPCERHRSSFPQHGLWHNLRRTDSAAPSAPALCRGRALWLCAWRRAACAHSYPTSGVYPPLVFLLWFSWNWTPFKERSKEPAFYEHADTKPETYGNITQTQRRCAVCVLLV